MAEETFRRVLEDWRGLDLRQTPLTREPGSFSAINNWVRGKVGSLRKRNGYQKVGQKMVFRALHRYAYAIPDGGNQSELIGVNHTPWRLACGTITITPPGGVNLRYTAYWEDSGSSKEFRFRLFNGSTPYVIDGALEYVVGTYSLLELIEKIDALAGFSVAVDVPFGRVNGAITIPASVGTTAVTVDAGHTITADTYIDVRDSGANFTGSTWFYVYATGATTFTVPRWPTQAVTLADNAIVGPLVTTVDSLGIRINSTSALTIKFYYWEPVCIPWTDEYRPAYVAMTNTAPLNSLNIDNLAVFTLPSSASDTSVTTKDSLNAPSYILDQPSVANKPMKYDRQNFYRLGIGIDVKTATNIGAGSIPAGTYRWKFLYKMQDQVDHIIRSLPYYAGELTLAGVSTVQISGTAFVSTPEFHTCSKGAYAAGAQAGVTTIVVDTNGTVGWSRPNIDVGDYVLFRESTVAPPRLTRRLVTAVVRSTAPYSVTISGAAVTIDDNEPISVGLSIEVYRTENGGSTYYLAGEYASPPYLQAVRDDIADAALSFALEEPLEGEEPYFPPRAVCLCEHQGKLCLSGDTNYPNTVYYSLPASIEQFNAGFFAFDVPSYDSGQVKALVSDSSTQLAVFKDRAFYSIEGDLSTGLLNNNVISEGDFGVSSQPSVQKTPRGWIAVGKSGMFEFKDGQIIEPHLELRPTFAEANYNFTEARGIWLSGSRQFRFLSSTLRYLVDFTRMPVFVSTASWPLLGSRLCVAEFDNKIFMSVLPNGTVVVETDDGSDSNSVYLGPPVNRYLDDGAAVGEFYLEVPADTMGEPSINKYFLRLKLYSIYTAEEYSAYVANRTTVEIHPGLIQGSLNSATPQSTLNFDFNAISTVSAQQKLPSLQAVGLGFLISDGSGQFGSPHLTAFEMVVNLPYQKRDVK